MFLARRPSEEAIDRWLAAQEAAPLPTSSVTSDYTVDHNRVTLATDLICFGRAREALRHWQHFRLGWVDIVPARPPIRLGTTVGVLVRHLGFWSLNASRIVTVFDEPTRFGFLYRTLADHAEDGDERFTVEWDADARALVYELLARSRPRHPLARMGHPFARRLQRRFAADSMRAMEAAVQHPG